MEKHLELKGSGSFEVKLLHAERWELMNRHF